MPAGPSSHAADHSGLSKSAIRSTGKRLAKGTPRPNDWDTLRAFRAARAEQMGPLFRDLLSVASGTTAVLSCRLKRLPTIVRKLQRFPSMALEGMDDVLGFRLISSSIDSQTHLCHALQGHLGAPDRLRDYLEAPPPTCYRAIHLIYGYNVGVPDYPEERAHYELQLRTAYQNLWSSMSEAFGDQTKEGGGSLVVRAYLAKLAQQISMFESQHPSFDQLAGHVSTQQPIEYLLLHYDRASRQVVDIYPLGSAPDVAIRTYVELEDRFLMDVTQEIVLLGSPAGSSIARITHLRYFAGGGLIDLPEVFRDAVGPPPQLHEQP